MFSLTGPASLSAEMSMIIVTSRQLLLLALDAWRQWKQRSGWKRINNYLPITEKSQEALEFNKNNKKELREIRFLPQNIDFSTITNIYGNKVAIFSLKHGIFGVLIDNSEIADNQKKIFDILWRIAKRS